MKSKEIELTEYITLFTHIKHRKYASETAIKKYLLTTNATLTSFVLEKLECGWSPEQIAGRLKKEIKGRRPQTEYINRESIYQWIYDAAQKPLWL